MDPNLKLKAFGGMVMLSLSLGVILFVCAGTLNYWQSWLFLVILSTATTLSIFDLLKNDPVLLESRINAGPVAEKR